MIITLIITQFIITYFLVKHFHNKTKKFLVNLASKYEAIHDLTEKLESDIKTEQEVFSGNRYIDHNN